MKRTSVILWVSGAVAASTLVLGVNGSLSSWTQAVLTNTNNNVATSAAVILRETDGTNTCTSSTSTTNVANCATVNKYGGTTTPLVPGGSQTVTVTFSNVGSAPASSFVLSPAACGQTPLAGSGSPAVSDLCGNGDLTVTLSCVDGATYTGTPWTDLKFAAASPTSFYNSGASYTHAAGLAAGASATCRFTLALSAAASPNDQNITASQQMTWTLNK